MNSLRAWHGYLSAFAFLILIFFAATGILINHPDWSQAKPPMLTDKAFDLAPAELALLKSAAEPGPKLAEMTSRRIKLEGQLVNAQIDGDELFIRLQGIRGGSIVAADLRTGHAEANVDRQYGLAIIGELHRSEKAGDAWKLFVDLAGVLLIAVASVGYGLFLAMRHRLRTALALTASSLALMGLLIAFFVQ